MSAVEAIEYGAKPVVAAFKKMFAEPWTLSTRFDFDSPVNDNPDNVVIGKQTVDSGLVFCYGDFMFATTVQKGFSFDDDDDDDYGL